MNKEGVLSFFRENDLFARHCGIDLIDSEPGYAKARMPLQAFHLNGAGTVHGGAIFTLADFTFAVAANNRGQLALAINTTTSFFKANREGTLFAEAQELSLNKRLGHYQVRITDENDNLIALFQGTAYRKDEVLFASQQPG